jgi:hypothetical protein
MYHKFLRSFAICCLLSLNYVVWANPPICANPAVPTDQSALPAEIVGETKLGPAAGNGTHPFETAVDTRRNRMWVLNRVPQSLSVVDLATRCVIGVVPLTEPRVPEFDGWFNSAPHIWIGYDTRSDHVLVGAGTTAVRGVLVSVDAGTRQVSAVRKFMDRLSYRWAINAKRGEVIVAGMGPAYQGGFGLMTLDPKTLETRRDFATRQIEAMAASESSGRLYTVEPSNPKPATCGMGGPYSSTQVFVRDTASGAIIAQSPGDYSYPRALFVEDTSHQLYLVHRSDRLHMISDELTTVTVLSQSTLKQERTIHYAQPDANNNEEFLSWTTTWLDAPRHRLVVDRYDGSLATLQLAGPPKATEVPVEGSKYSGYRLAGVLQSTGEPLLLIDNEVRLLNPRTLQSGESITLGANIQGLFLDEKRHKLIAYVDRGVHEFLMLENNLSRGLFKSHFLPNSYLLTVDFNHEAIYSVHADGWGSDASLEVMNFRGEHAAGGYEAEGEFSGLIITDTPGRSFRLLFPAFPENTHALPRCSLDLLIGGREAGSVKLPWAYQPPSQLLYAARADRVYLLYGQKLTIYAGSDLAASGTISLAALTEDRSKNTGPPGMLAVDPTGEFAYYADPVHNQVLKLRLADGGVGFGADIRIVARRELTFSPTLPLIDSTANRLYLADNNGGRIVAIRLF